MRFSTQIYWDCGEYRIQHKMKRTKPTVCFRKKKWTVNNVNSDNKHIRWRNMY